MKRIVERLRRLRLSRKEKIAAGAVIVCALIFTPFLASAENLIPGADVVPPAPPSSGLKAPDRVAPVRFCKEAGMYVDEKYRLGTGCSQAITCLMDPAVHKYRCQNAKGVPVVPPACRNKADRAYYVCDDQNSVYVATLQPYAVYTNGPTTGVPEVRPQSTAFPGVEPQATPLPIVTSAPPQLPTVTSAAPQPTAVVPAGTADAIRAARAAKLRTWVEHDLSADYLTGDPQYRTALQALIAAAKQPGVTGVKFADYLGYPRDGRTFTGEDDVKQFLTTTATALRTALPGKRLAIGVAVPELGCGSSAPCATAMRAKAPLATKKAVGDYLAAVTLDRVELADGLWGPTYRKYKITAAGASAAQWQAVRALGWDTWTQVTSRQYGLAHTGDTSQWDQATATAQVDTLVGNVIGKGVPSVTLWGHKSLAGQDTYRLLDTGLAPNLLWTALTGKGLRDRLAVVVDPASTERGAAADIATLAQGVSEIFILV
ncbi:hypothetical protein [Nonomuraea sediminis]|uniref:hypothetical protein n=1 Tax=Nonomuraea sediminis TaxID=2835864 RepID=UPI001BDC9FC6|nr:hypothetical protein [Nonomuraea sediminis]